MTHDPAPRDRFSSDREQANKSLKAMLRFILDNRHQLAKVDKGNRMVRAAVEMNQLLRDGIDLTPGQRSYVEGIYEATHKGAGYESCGVHVDKKRKGMRFG